MDAAQPAFAHAPAKSKNTSKTVSNGCGEEKGDVIAENNTSEKAGDLKHVAQQTPSTLGTALCPWQHHSASRLSTMITLNCSHHNPGQALQQDLGRI